MFEIVFHFFGELILWVVLLPIAWLVSSPIILILAFFGKDPYRQAVGEMFSNVTEFWRRWI